MQDIKHKIDCAMGRVKCDTVLKNANVVDVFCHKINKCDVAITDGKIVGLGEYSGNIEIDVEGKYVLPSFYDTHLHFESSMLTPDEYIKLIAPKGVTMINADPHEIANVCGLDGINFMLESTINSPVKINFMFPSCVPATPFDHGNAVLDSAIIAEQMKRGNFFGLAEMMNYPGVINADSDVLKKIETSNHIDGHAPRLNGKELNAYLTTGITTDHECETVDEVFEKVSKGMFVMIREGSQTKNLKYLIKSFNEYTKRRLIFCTDDRYVGDIIESGSISNCIATSIESGVDPIDAIIMGSLNAYDCYGIPNKGAVAINYDADLIVSSDLSTLNIDMVFCGGVKIAEKGKALFDIKKANQSKVINTVNIKEVTEKDFDLPFVPNKTPIMEVIPHTVVTKKIYCETMQNLNLCAVIERHKATGNVGVCYVKGFNLIGGAIAQTVGHDAHNITVIGDNSRDMALAVNALGKQGGMALVTKGKVECVFPLPIAGLMSDKTAEETLILHNELIAKTSVLNINQEIEPFMLLSFLSLIVIPDIKITDIGLFDVTKFEFIKD